ncbi:MAG TPA: phage terminase large subunit family protein [Pyrinomonadaceae bacterium]|nr:phage terminase large subunit family protein [Pyrinomonadaceae bacterium]
MSLEKITSVFSEALRAAIPEAFLTVSMWAATYRFLSAERSARPGRWRNEVTPYLVEIMDSVTKPGVREVVFVKSAQIAGTEGANNIIGYFMHADPSPILYTCETEPKAEAWSKESLAPMIRDTPVLASIVSDARSRDSGNTIEGKSFAGGHLAIGYATSAATASSRPRRVVILDERDAYKETAEGDYCKLAEKRTTTFPDAVIFKPSTPRDRLEPEPGSPPDAPRYSPIELEYENSDKRRYHVPCPHCGEYQVLEWGRVKWDSEEEVLDAYYVCTNGCLIEHEHKADMLARGKWIAEKPFKGRVGFHLWEGYSPFVTWGQMAQNFLEAKKNKATLKVFINTSLAEGWEELPEQAHTDDLASRREPFEAEVPDGVLVITASADVQGNRLETEIVGWGLDEESWSLKYEVIEGDPALPAVWEKLKELWTTPLAREDGTEMKVQAACVDSGGHHTKQVYRFCRQNRGRRWFAVKGSNTPGKPLVSKFTLQGRPPVRLYTVGTEAAKDEISNRLLITEPGPGCMHFPEGRDEDYFKQLRSERPVMRYTRGQGVRKWEKIRPSARNEALDLRVYATAALTILSPNLKALQRKRAAGEALEVRPAAEPETEVEETAAPEDAGAAVLRALAELPDESETPRPPGRARRRRGGFATRW